MSTSYVITPPAPARPATTQPQATAIQSCVDPALVSPLHLPALSDVAADLDGLNTPVKIVNPIALDRCQDCAHEDDVPELGAIATVVAYDEHGFRYFLATCALHLAGIIRHYRSHGWATVVEVPTCSPRWFERSDRETYWALDESRGIGVTRTHVGGWAAWNVVDRLTDSVPLALFAADCGDAASRLDAECWAQAYAAQRAADAYEESFSDAVTVALPVVVVSGVAA